MLLIGSTILIYRMAKGFTVVFIVGCLGLMAMIFWLSGRLDDLYISKVVSDLSLLCENLVTLEENEVFPENEDTMLSKLQSRIRKLVRILRRKNERSLQEQENIKRLVSDISHQLKVPLANLKMYTEFLEEKTISKQQRSEYVDVLRLSVERLQFLSENLIKVSRLEGGLINLHMESQSINETVLKAVKDIFAKARSKRIEITYSGEREILVIHDSRWTAEAMFNLLDNAVKYSPCDCTIKVTLRQLGMFMAVDVEDMAPVIPEEEKAEVFKRFYRGQHSQNTEGMGLGLYLAREIVIRQGGYLNLRRGKMGNVFSMFLMVDS